MLVFGAICLHCTTMHSIMKATLINNCLLVDNNNIFSNVTLRKPQRYSILIFMCLHCACSFFIVFFAIIHAKNMQNGLATFKLMCI